MKKLIYGTIMSVALAVGIIYAAQRTEQPKLTPLQLENAEALADIELVSGGTWIVTVYSMDHWKCNPGGELKCPGTPW